MKRRVVVTGLGAVTPVGNTVEEFWSSVREGKVESVPSQSLILRNTR